MKQYLTVGNAETNEIVINKSRFIGLTYLLDSEDEISLCLDDAAGRYPQASHYCYGAVLGIDGLLQRFSDNGEPGGTAGMPILQVILQKELKNLLVVVVRYFGGIKLGAGGLVRAYTKAAAEVIDKAGIVKMIPSSRGILTIDYHLLGSVEHFLRQDGIIIQDIRYGEEVSISILTNYNWDELTKKLNDICSGNINIEKIDDIYYHW